MVGGITKKPMNITLIVTLLNALTVRRDYGPCLVKKAERESE
jgi:hypothetical protein